MPIDQGPFTRFPKSNSFFKRMYNHICAVVASIALFGILIVINALQTLSLAIKPFSGKLFRHFNRDCANTWWSLCVFWLRYVYGMKGTFTGDVIPEKENALVFANHQEMSDIVVLFTFGYEKKRLGDMKWFLKDVLKYAPGVGWGLLFLDSLFVKRNWDADHKMIENTFAKFRRENIPMWLVTYVEGTRITPAKRARSQAYSKNAGLPILQNVLVPRTKGFAASIYGLKEHITAVYDVTIGYPDGVPSLWQMLQGIVPSYNMHIRRFDISDVPKDEASASKWIIDRFVEKDQLLTEFHRKRQFPGAPTIL